MVKRPGMGRRKIEIKRIQNEDARQVCFSKRKAGLIKKAQELSILTGSEIAVLIFSQAGKPFSFGYPSVDTVIDRFLAHPHDLPKPRSAPALPDPLLSSTLSTLGRQHDDLLSQIAQEKKLRAQLELKSKSDDRFWWEANVEDIPIHQLERYGLALEELRKNVLKRADELMLKARLEGQGYSAASSCLTLDGSPVLSVNPLVDSVQWKKNGLDLMTLDDPHDLNNKDHEHLFF